MKDAFCICIILLTHYLLQAQTPDRQAYLLVEQTWNGNADTIWFGVDYEADNNYNPGLDIMYTTFSYPLAIRLQNGQVQADSNTCAANMRRDIKAFAPEVTWDVFFKSDTFNADENLPIDSNFFLRWDTAQFNYSDGQYELLYAYLNTSTGYVNGIDGEEACISTNIGCGGSSGSYPDAASLIYIGIQPPEYNSTFCETEEYIFKFTLHAVFDDLLDIDANTGSNIEFIHQYSEQVSQINNDKGGSMAIEVFQLNGNRIFNAKTFESTYNFNYQQLPNGFLIVRVSTDDDVPQTFSLIHY